MQQSLIINISMNIVLLMELLIRNTNCNMYNHNARNDNHNININHMRGIIDANNANMNHSWSTSTPEQQPSQSWGHGGRPPLINGRHRSLEFGFRGSGRGS